MCTYIPAYINTCTCIHTHTYIHTCTYIHTYVRTYACTYVRTYIHTYIHTSVSNKLNWRDIGPKGNNTGTQHRHPRAFVAQKDD